MSRRALVVVVLIVAAAAAWLLWGRDSPLRTGEVPTAPTAEDQAARSTGGPSTNGGGDDHDEPAPNLPNDASTTMTLAGGDVSLSYPAGFGLAVNQDQLLVSSNIPVCDAGFDYCIYLNTDEYDDTNFDGAGLNITIRDDLEYEAACVLEPPNGFNELEPVLGGGSSHVTAVFGSVGQGAAGHFTNGAVHRLYYGDTCYEFETRIAQTQFANFEPGAVDRFEDADLEDLRSRFATILASTSLPDGRDELWSREITDNALVESIQVRNVAPEAGSTVSSPLEVSGEALGVWFFEGSFPYRLQTESGDVLASGAVQAQGDWMTTDFVRFSATLEFDVAAETPGALILMNDNPSGLPENDASLTVPLTLRP